MEIKRQGGIIGRTKLNSQVVFWHERPNIHFINQQINKESYFAIFSFIVEDFNLAVLQF